MREGVTPTKQVCYMHPTRGPRGVCCTLVKYAAPELSVMHPSEVCCTLADCATLERSVLNAVVASDARRGVLHRRKVIVEMRSKLECRRGSSQSADKSVGRKTRFKPKCRPECRPECRPGLCRRGSSPSAELRPRECRPDKPILNHVIERLDLVEET